MSFLEDLSDEQIRMISEHALGDSSSLSCGSLGDFEGITTYTRTWSHEDGSPILEIRPGDGRVPALELVPDAPADHLARILAWLGPATRGKYDRGQREHGGCLSQKPGLLAEAEDEALDLPVYLHTLREQIGHALGELEAARASTCNGAWMGHVDNARDILAAVLER